jgi:hypothetical protein
MSLAQADDNGTTISRNHFVVEKKVLSTYSVNGEIPLVPSYFYACLLFQEIETSGRSTKKARTVLRKTLTVGSYHYNLFTSNDCSVFLRFRVFSVSRACRN